MMNERVVLLSSPCCLRGTSDGVTDENENENADDHDYEYDYQSVIVTRTRSRTRSHLFLVRKIASAALRPRSARFISVRGAVVATLTLLISTVQDGNAQHLDLLIRNGRVFDGSGNPEFNADVGIVEDRIVAVGRLEGLTADRIIDATGLHVSPGFIDLHSHADAMLASESLEGRRAHNLVSQGITTVLGGPDGSNPLFPLSEEIAAYERLGIAINFVPMVGHGTIRRAVMEDDYERIATEAEVERMRALVRDGMEAGAWGMGAGLEYRPGRFSDRSEVLALAEVVAEYGGFYIAHQRSEIALPLWQLPSIVDDWPLDGIRALRETIEIARRTGIRVVASHAKAASTSSWGTASHQVRLVDAARAEGLQVYFDQYPYTTAGGGLWNRLPQWAFAPPDYDRRGGNDDPRLSEEGVLDAHRRNLRSHVADPERRRLLETDIEWLTHQQGGPDVLVILDYPDSTLIGRTVSDVAKSRGMDYRDLLIEMALSGHDRPGGVLLRGAAMEESDVEMYMRQEYTATSSDAAISPPGPVSSGQHPRFFGAFVRKLAHYVKDRDVIPLPFAIRAATGLPAQIIGLTDRGYVRPGFIADLVIFDFERLRDHATVLEPGRYSEGIEYVLVNGELTVDGGALTGTLPGRVVRNEPGPCPRASVCSYPW